MQSWRHSWGVGSPFSIRLHAKYSSGCKVQTRATVDAETRAEAESSHLQARTESELHSRVDCVVRARLLFGRLALAFRRFMCVWAFNCFSAWLPDNHLLVWPKNVLRHLVHVTPMSTPTASNPEQPWHPMPRALPRATHPLAHPMPHAAHPPVTGCQRQKRHDQKSFQSTSLLQFTMCIHHPARKSLLARSMCGHQSSTLRSSPQRFRCRRYCRHWKRKSTICPTSSRLGSVCGWGGNHGHLYGVLNLALSLNFSAPCEIQLGLRGSDLGDRGCRDQGRSRVQPASGKN